MFFKGYLLAGYMQEDSCGGLLCKIFLNEDAL